MQENNKKILWVFLALLLTLSLLFIFFYFIQSTKISEEDALLQKEKERDALIEELLKDEGDPSQILTEEERNDIVQELLKEDTPVSNIDKKAQEEERAKILESLLQ